MTLTVKPKIELAARVLTACLKRKIISQVIDSAHINLPKLNQITDELAKKSLLLIVEEQRTTRFHTRNGKHLPSYALSDAPHRYRKRRFETTEKGRQFLDAYSKVIMIYTSTPIQVEAVQ